MPAPTGFAVAIAALAFDAHPVVFAPRLPTAWALTKARYRSGQTVYEITMRREEGDVPKPLRVTRRQT